jgi:hypothetical protein
MDETLWQSHVSALQAIVSAQERLIGHLTSSSNDLESIDSRDLSNMWRHEAYKVNLQKSALESHAVVVGSALLTTIKQQRISLRDSVLAQLDICVQQSLDKIERKLQRCNKRLDFTQKRVAAIQLATPSLISNVPDHRREINSILGELKSMENEAAALIREC